MHEVIKEHVSVLATYDCRAGLFMPRKLRWQAKTYDISKLGYHHSQKQGNILVHIFSVSDGGLAFKLSFDTRNLRWTLMEVSDGLGV